MERETVNATVVSGYIHTVNDVKVIDIHFNSNIVKVYRNSELSLEDTLRVSMKDFRNIIIPSSRNIALIYAVNQLDTTYPIRDIEFNSIFTDCEVALDFTFINEGEEYDVKGIEKKAENAKILKSLRILRLSDEGNKFCQYPLRVYHEQEIRKSLLEQQILKEMKK